MAAVLLVGGCSASPGLLVSGGVQVTAVHNGAPHPIVLEVSAPRTSLDCSVLLANPSAVASLLASVERTPSERVVLRPNQLIDPLRYPDDDTLPGYGSNSCGVRRIEVEGLGTRWIVADFEVLPGRAFPPAATLSELGEGVVTVLPRASDPFRATSPDLLYPTDEPLPSCPDEVSDEPMTIHVEGLVGSFDGVVESATTTLEAGRTCTDVVFTLFVSEGDVPEQMLAQICADAALPDLPFVFGETPVRFRWSSTEEGDRIQLTGDIASWTATTTMALSPQAVRFEAPAWAEPICLDPDPGCTHVTLDRLTLSMERLDDERELLAPVFPGTVATFEVPTGGIEAGIDSEVERVEVWVDEVRTRMSAAPECEPQPVEMVFVRSLVSPLP